MALTLRRRTAAGAAPRSPIDGRADGPAVMVQADALDLQVCAIQPESCFGEETAHPGCRSEWFRYPARFDQTVSRAGFHKVRQ